MCVLLGEPSGGLVDVNLDCSEAITLAGSFLPETASIFGRTNKPRSHRLYVCDPSARSEKFCYVDGMTLLEIRSTKCQTFFLPSEHSGEVVAWAEE